METTSLQKSAWFSFPSAAFLLSLNAEEYLRSICLFISRRDRLNWGMIHASNLCLLFLYCQWLMRGNCKSSQREALLEAERRIREGASKVVFTVQGFSFHCWSVRDFPNFLLSELDIISKGWKLLGWVNTCISTLAAAQDESGKCPPMQRAAFESSHPPGFWMRSLLWGRSNIFWCSLKIVPIKLPGHSSP